MKRISLSENVIDLGNLDDSFYLIGLLNEFVNRLQTTGDTFFDGISWKQCFLLNCITFFEVPPTLRELSEMMGSSHQNIKQMLIKLENSGYVITVIDENDKRKQRIYLTKKAKEFRERFSEPSDEFMKQLFYGIEKDALQTTIQTITILDERIKKFK